MKMKRLSTFVDDMVEPSARKRGFALSRLIAHWGEVAGDMASWCKPVELKLSKDNNDGTLKLSIASGRGPQAQQMAPSIIDRVNASFGYAAVSRITFVQTMTHHPVTSFAAPPDAHHGASGPNAHGPNALGPNAQGPNTSSESAQETHDVWTLDEKLAGIKSPELRAALRRLGTPADPNTDSD